LGFLREFLAPPPAGAKRGDSEGEALASVGLLGMGRFEHWHALDTLKRAIPAMVSAAPVATLDLLMDTLAGWMARPDPEEIGASYESEHTSMWRVAIEDHKDNHRRDMRDALVTALRMAVELHLAGHPESMDEMLLRLSARPGQIFRRVVLHLLRSFPQGREEDILAVLRSHAESGDEDLRYERFHLAKDCFPRLSPGGQRRLLDWIAAGPDLDAVRSEWEELRGAAPTDEELAGFAKAWRLQQLTPIADHLSGPERAAHDALASEIGPIRHPDRGLGVVVEWEGPESPRSDQDIAKMSASELVAALRDWRAGDEEFAPSAEGFGRTVTAVVEAAPEKYAADAGLFRGLDPTYVRGLLQGFTNAARRGTPFAVAPILDLCKWVVSQPIEISRSERIGDADPSWSWARKEVADLLEECLKGKGAHTLLALRSAVWEVLRPLTTDPDPTPERDTGRGESGMDPLTLSINTTRGQAMHAVIQYALWVLRDLESRGADVAAGGEALSSMAEVQAVLEDRLLTDPSPAVRAVFGRYFPWLVRLSPKWASEHVDAIFGRADQPDELGISAWDVYIVTCRVYDATADLLLGHYERALRRLGERAPAPGLIGDPDERLAEHLMVRYWQGKLALGQPEGLLPIFFARATDELRAHALTFVGHSLDRTGDAIPSDTLERLKALWESRLAAARASANPSDHSHELASFGAWYCSGKFEAPWALLQLGEVVELAQRVEPPHRVLERLAIDAPSNPADVLRVFGALALGSSRYDPILAWQEECGAVLEACIASRDPGVLQQARDLINRLIAGGALWLRDFLPPGPGTTRD
jgi:hypothetical protein